MEIELDIFSGRPNPVWRLSEERAAMLLDRIDFSKGSRHVQNIPDLGYRGFLIRRGSDLLRVFNGYVTIEDEPGHLAVEDNGIEAELMKDARERGFGDILSAL